MIPDAALRHLAAKVSSLLGHFLFGLRDLSYGFYHN